MVSSFIVSTNRFGDFRMMMGRVFVSATTYVKDYGWHKAKEMLNKARGCRTIKVSGYFFLYDDLERLVKSYELVQRHETGSYSALENAKQHVLTLAHIEEYEKMYALEKAIADVESCL